MQTIRIILSADKSLTQERQEISDLVENLNHSLESRGANILMLAWDSAKENPEDFKDKISDTDLCLTLYYDTFVEASKTELETAYQALCEGKSPRKIYVYFKDAENVPTQLQEFRDSFPTKYGHFYCPFSNIDTLKADFLLQFMEYQSKNLGSTHMLELKKGKVVVDGKEYVELKNVPFAGNNEEYNLLLKSIKKTQKLLAITDEEDEEYAEYASELQELKEKLAKMEASLWDTALMITRLSTTKCSERLKRAMDLFNAGDNKGAQAVLNEEEIEKDVQHNLHLIQLGEEGKKGLKINIEEYELKIKTLENEMAEGWLQEQCKLHERIVELSSSLYGEQSLELANAIMAAIQPHYLLENYTKIYDYIQKALDIRVKILGEKHLDTAQCYNDLGVASGKLGNFEKYLTLVNKGLEIRLKLNADNSALAESYHCVGQALFLTSGDKTKLLDYALKSLELRKEAFGEHHLETAHAISEVGSAYFELDDFEKALEYSIQALEIRENLVGDRHPDTGLSHNNVATAYIFLEKYDAAIVHLNKALDTSVSTVGKVAQGSLTIIDNLSFVHEKNGNIEKSLDYIMDAIKISEKLNGETDAQTITFFRRAGELLVEYDDRKAALNYLYHALDLHFKKAKEENLPTGPAPTRELADLCHKIGSIHFGMNAFAEAERMLSNAVNIISDVKEDAPVLRNWTYHLGLAYARQGKHDEALNTFKVSLEHRIKAYGTEHPDVVDAYMMVGHAYAALNNNDSAIEAFQTALGILEKHLPDDHEEIIRIKQLIKDLSQK